MEPDLKLVTALIERPSFYVRGLPYKYQSYRLPAATKFPLGRQRLVLATLEQTDKRVMGTDAGLGDI